MAVVPKLGDKVWVHGRSSELKGTLVQVRAEHAQCLLEDGRHVWVPLAGISQLSQANVPVVAPPPAFQQHSPPAGRAQAESSTVSPDASEGERMAVPALAALGRLRPSSGAQPVRSWLAADPAPSSPTAARFASGALPAAGSPPESVGRYSFRTPDEDGQPASTVAKHTADGVVAAREPDPAVAHEPLVPTEPELPPSASDPPDLQLSPRGPSSRHESSQLEGGATFGSQVSLESRRASPYEVERQHERPDSADPAALRDAAPGPPPPTGETPATVGTRAPRPRRSLQAPRAPRRRLVAVAWVVCLAAVAAGGYLLFARHRAVIADRAQRFTDGHCVVRAPRPWRIDSEDHTRASIALRNDERGARFRLISQPRAQLAQSTTTEKYAEMVNPQGFAAIQSSPLQQVTVGPYAGYRRDHEGAMEGASVHQMQYVLLTLEYFHELVAEADAARFQQVEAQLEQIAQSLRCGVDRSAR